MACKTHSCHCELSCVDEAGGGSLAVFTDDGLAFTTAFTALIGDIQTFSQIPHAAGAIGNSVANLGIGNSLAKTYVHRCHSKVSAEQWLYANHNENNCQTTIDAIRKKTDGRSA
jgi:hypothetical protein